MISQENSKTSRALSRWVRTRQTAGFSVIVAVIATLVAGTIALKNDEDTSSAMKLPATLVVFSLITFIHVQKKILATEKALRR